jgi:hypothetical protein
MASRAERRRRAREEAAAAKDTVVRLAPPAKDDRWFIKPGTPGVDLGLRFVGEPIEPPAHFLYFTKHRSQ